MILLYYNAIYISISKINKYITLSLSLYTLYIAIVINIWYNDYNGKGVFLKKTPQANSNKVVKIMTVSKAQKKATAKYEKEKYDKVLVRLPKGKKEKIQTISSSVNGFINKAIDEKIEKDTGKKE